MPLEWAMGTLRFSVGRGTVCRSIDRAIEVVAGAVRRLQTKTTLPNMEVT